MRPDDGEPRPGLRVVDRLVVVGPGPGQDPVHHVPGLPLLLLGHLGADHRLHQAVHLDAGAHLVDPGQREPADLPDHAAQHQLLLQRGVVRLERVDHLLAVEQLLGDRLGGQEGTQLEQPDRRGGALAQPGDGDVPGRRHRLGVGGRLVEGQHLGGLLGQLLEVVVDGGGGLRDPGGRLFHGQRQVAERGRDPVGVLCAEAGRLAGEVLHALLAQEDLDAQGGAVPCPGLVA